jgi:hypothetical protein
MRTALGIVVCLACTPADGGGATAPKADAPAKAQAPAKGDEMTTTRDPSLTGYPWARLVVDGNPVEPLALELPAAELVALGVKSHRTYTATTPRVWLLAFEFESQPKLFEAEPKILALWPADAAPYHRQTSHTGGWLLVTGFPSHKPVSPEMERAREQFRSSWAGEE